MIAVVAAGQAAQVAAVLQEAGETVDADRPHRAAPRRRRHLSRHARAMTTPRKRVAILISGRGSNMAALIEAAGDRDYPGRDRRRHLRQGRTPAASPSPRRKGIADAASSRAATIASKDAHDAAIDAALDALRRRDRLPRRLHAAADAALRRELAGPDDQHPPLAAAALSRASTPIERALDAGMRIHGCTVHFVTPEMDDGPIIAQAAVPVLIGDTRGPTCPRACSRPSTSSTRWRCGWSRKARRAWKTAAPCSPASPTTATEATALVTALAARSRNARSTSKRWPDYAVRLRRPALPAPRTQTLLSWKAAPP